MDKSTHVSAEQVVVADNKLLIQIAELTDLVKNMKERADTQSALISNLLEERENYIQIIEHGKKQDAIKDAVIVKLEDEIKSLHNRLKRYENCNSPPSTNNAPIQKKKSERRKNQKKGKVGKVGAKPKHKGYSHSIKSEYTIRYLLAACMRCGSSNMTETLSIQQQTLIAKLIVNAVNEMSFDQHCNDCGYDNNTDDQLQGVKGTMLDKTLTAMAIKQRRYGTSIKAITETLRCIDKRISHAMVDGAIKSGADKLKKHADEIKENNKRSKYIMMDETKILIENKTGWVWVLIGDSGVQITIGDSRGKKFAQKHFGLYEGIPLVCDGCPVYNIFKKRQRCWSHVLRHAEDAICDKPTERLYQKVYELFTRSKQLQVTSWNQVTPQLRVQVQSLIQEAKDLAQEYHKLDNQFGVHLENASDNLFTFVTHPGMPPTNNDSERMLRPVVIYRKTCLRVMNEKSMERLSTIFTCVLTWERQGIDVYDKLLKVL